MAFSTKLELEQATDATLARVLDLQASLCDGVDGVTLEKVGNEVLVIVALHKEMQQWEAEETTVDEEHREEGNQVSPPTTSNGAKQTATKTEPVEVTIVDTDTVVLTQHAEALETKLSTAEATIATLEKELLRQQLVQKQMRKVESEREKQKRKQTEAEAEVLAAKAALAALKKELANEREQIAKLQAANKTLVETETSLICEQQQLRGDVTELTAKNKWLATKLDSAETTSNSLHSEIARLETSIREAPKAVLENRTNFQTVLKNMDKVEKANKRLTEKNARLDAEIKTVRLEAEKVEKERTAEMTERVTVLEMQVTTVISEKAELLATVEKLTVEKAQLLQSMEQSKETESVMVQRLVAAEQQLKQLATVKEECAALQVTVKENAATFTEEKSELVWRATMLTEEKNLLSVKITELEQLLVKEKATLKTLGKEKKHTAAQIRALTCDLLATKVAAERAVGAGASNAIKVADLTATIETTKSQRDETLKKLEAATLTQASLAAELERFRAAAATHEDTLRKMRAALLQADEAMRAVRASVVNWKNKQLAKARSELTAATASRMQQVDETGTHRQLLLLLIPPLVAVSLYAAYK